MKRRTKARLRRGIFPLTVVAALLFGGCGAESTDDICDDACSAWEPCWGYDLCFDECKAEGDWDEIYAQCCMDHAGDCIALENICG